MNIMKKFNNRAEYQNWVFCLYNDLVKWNKSLWNDEDMPLLSPFFEWEKLYREDYALKMSEEVKASFDYLKVCDEKYAEKRAEYRDAFRDFVDNGMPSFLTHFLFEDLTESGDSYEELDEWEYTFEHFKLNEYIPDEPFVLFVCADTGFDRFGNSSLFVIEFETLRELGIKN